MLQFYKRLRAGSNFAVALREAKLEQIREGTYAHPYHWAGYILAGRNVSLDGR
jgi:CHAT domain-containing protein